MEIRFARFFTKVCYIYINVKSLDFNYKSHAIATIIHTENKGKHCLFMTLGLN